MSESTKPRGPPSLASVSCVLAHAAQAFTPIPALIASSGFFVKKASTRLDGLTAGSVYSSAPSDLHSISGVSSPPSDLPPISGGRTHARLPVAVASLSQLSASTAERSHSTTTHRNLPPEMGGGLEGGDVGLRLSQLSASTAERSHSTTTHRNLPPEMGGGLEGGDVGLRLSQLSASTAERSHSTTTHRNLPPEMGGGLEGGDVGPRLSQLSASTAERSHSTTTHRNPPVGLRLSHDSARPRASGVPLSSESAYPGNDW